MFDKVAILGDQDLVFAFKAIGLKVFSPQSVEEARRILDDLEKENFAVCFLEESLYESLREERKALREKFCPVVIGFSDYRQISGYIDKMMRDTAIKATGSDSLVRKRGKDETR